VDIAMTKLFGSNSQSFYEAYNNEWPLPDGWELRDIIYNSYHVLNHYVLFGGGYANQANRMFETILDAEI
jgi:fructosamine-3-kinase